LHQYFDSTTGIPAMTIGGPQGEARSTTEYFPRHVLQDHRDYDALVTETVPDKEALSSIPYTAVFNAEVEHAEMLILHFMDGSGYFEVDDVESTLNNEIHPIFDPSRFIGFGSHAYENTKLALRLATQFISHGRFQKWFTHLINGHPNRDPDLEAPYLEKPH
jgi:hypothetical protein